jgi:hypothetical protein
VRIILRRHDACTEATKSSPCVACGTILRGECPFWIPVLGDRDRAVRSLLDAVRQWQDQPVCCTCCPERLALEAS